MYLALPVSSGRFPRATRVSRYSRTETKKILYFHLRDHYPLGSCFPAHSINIKFCNFSHNNILLKLWRFCLTTLLLRSTLRYELQRTGLLRIRLVLRSFRAKHKAKEEFGLLRFRSPLLAQYCSCEHCFLFLRVLKCFTSPSLRPV